MVGAPYIVGRCEWNSEVSDDTKWNLQDGMKRHSVNRRPRCVLGLRLRRSVKPRYEPLGLSVSQEAGQHRYEALGLSVQPEESGMGPHSRCWVCQFQKGQDQAQVGGLGADSLRMQHMAQVRGAGSVGVPGGRTAHKYEILICQCPRR